MKRLMGVVLYAFLCAPMTLFADKTRFLVGVEDLNLKPYFFNADGDYQGFSRVVLDRFAELYGYEFEYIILPVKRLHQELIAQGIDFKYPDNPNWNKAAKMGMNIAYSNSVISYLDAAMLAPENQGQGLQELRDLSVIRGFTVAMPYQEAVASGQLTIHWVSDLEAVLRMALLGRVDAAYMNVDMMRYYLKQQGLEGALIYDKGLPAATGNNFVSSVKYPEIIEQFNVFLAEDKAWLDSLKAEYGVNTIDLTQ